ncbi:MAG: hypothetical protein MSB10_06055 [Clostridiales bacterium]|uniref:hypothetical protein n=1 Tax=Flavonifractor porci TaxID=3133422 RepID=UPI0030A3AB63|nr:hypothetical protein [Clostridiales bacterium]
MADNSCRIKLFHLVKPSHTAFRTARERLSRKKRDTQAGHIRKKEKPPPAAPVSRPGLLNADQAQVADSPFLHGIGNLFFTYNLSVGCRDPPN